SHNIWLRDHCRCPRCFHALTKQRLVNTFDASYIAPLQVEAKQEGLEVTWPESTTPHVSTYPWVWLQRHSYDPILRPESEPESSHVYVVQKILWGSKILQAPPTISYDEAMAPDDQGLYKWLCNINTFGFSFVSDVPPTVEATQKLAERIGFIRETQYGRFWEFTSDLARGDTAYTTLALGAHTDNTYFTDPCGLQLFHLLSHEEGSGGATLLVDGFYVASLLKELHPKAYELLSTVPVPAHAAGETTSLYRPSPPSGYPVFSHDPVSGALTQVRWNNDDRSVMSHLAPNIVEDWYDAIRQWHKLLSNPESEYWVQLVPGMAVVVDNHRVLHGRSAFDGRRRMCGAYIGVDEYRSKLAVLEEKFAPQVKSLEGDVDVDGGRSVWSPAL
ncbi:Trimethyllysine dioxygenase, partial [Fistulina hepatica ATCC 64428]